MSSNTSVVVAKPIVKNKYWIVEKQGEKIATIQAVENGGFVYVHDDEREQYVNLQTLRAKHNVKFDRKLVKPVVEKFKDCYGYPCAGQPVNIVWDVRRKLGVYTKTKKSKSLFCAGYYVVNYAGEWTKEFSPKNIALTRHEFLGPFKTVDAQQRAYTKVIKG